MPILHCLDDLAHPILARQQHSRVEAHATIVEELVEHRIFLRREHAAADDVHRYCGTARIQSDKMRRQQHDGTTIANHHVLNTGNPDQALDTLAGSPPAQRAVQHGLRKRHKMTTGNLFALCLGFIRKTQAQIGQRDMTPLPPQAIEQTPQASPQEAQDRQRQPMEAPEEAHQNIGWKQFQHAVSDGGTSAPPGRL